MLSDDVHFKFVGDQIQAKEKKITAAFELFTKTFTAVVGGSVWLSMHPGISQAGRHRYAIVSDLLAIFLAIVAAAMVLEDLRSWRGYRLAQVRIAEASGNRMIPRPKVWAAMEEIFMVAAMFVMALLFCRFNPFAAA